jgi:hypothetical protein
MLTSAAPLAVHMSMPLSMKDGAGFLGLLVLRWLFEATYRTGFVELMVLAVIVGVVMVFRGRGGSSTPWYCPQRNSIDRLFLATQPLVLVKGVTTMPVLALFTGKLTKAEYDTLRKEVDRENKHPADGLFHAASFDDEGQVHVADVWASENDLNAFAQNHLMPAFAKHNIAPPSVALYPTHKVVAYSDVEQFKV